MENNKSRSKKDSILNRILEKYGECNDNSFLHIAINHLGVYEKYLKLLQEKGEAAFPNRLEYQKFQVAKLFIDKLKLLEFSLDPSLKGFKEYKDSTLPPLDAFTMTPEVKETRKIKFLRSIDRGDLLHLKVVEVCNEEYKLLVLNKYNDNERLVDYFIYAYIMKTYMLEKLPRSLKVNDLIRATVFGKLKMEGNIFSKLVVSFNENHICGKYKDIELGIIFESEIPFYPEDITNCNSFLNHMKASEKPEDSQELIKCMSSLGIDPYKIYSFHESGDGKKLGVPKEPSSQMELKTMEKSMNLVKEAEKQLLQGADRMSLLPLLEEALEICPKNDAAYAIRGQLYKGEGNMAKTDEIMKIIFRCQDVCDVTKTFQVLEQNEEEKQS
ncbi:unnamed protein product [Larinioides sclopetarius]|uniref:Uncharacterized protein n=1 Tax=Larinioides sclopetarius TaxID=280406 RepID=A0AAV2BGF8_9ARAC